MVLWTGIPFMALKWWITRVERRVKRLPAANRAIRVERDRIIRMWKDEPIPDL